MPRKKRFNFPLSFPAKIRIFRTNQYKKEKNVSEFRHIFLFFISFSFFYNLTAATIFHAFS